MYDRVSFLSLLVSLGLHLTKSLRFADSDQDDMNSHMVSGHS